MITIARGDAGFTVIEDYAAYESVADSLFKFAQRIVPTSVTSYMICRI